MNLADHYFEVLNAKRAAFQVGQPKPLTPWQRITRSFGRGAVWGGAKGLAIGAIVPQALAALHADPHENLGIRTAVGSVVGGTAGAIAGGMSSVVEDEMRRRVNIEARRKIIEAQRYEELAGGKPAAAMDLAAMGIPKNLGIPSMGLNAG